MVLTTFYLITSTVSYYGNKGQYITHFTRFSPFCSDTEDIIKIIHRKCVLVNKTKFMFTGD